MARALAAHGGHHIISIYYLSGPTIFYFPTVIFDEIGGGKIFPIVTAK